MLHQWPFTLVSLILVAVEALNLFAPLAIDVAVAVAVAVLQVSGHAYYQVGAGTSSF